MVWEPGPPQGLGNLRNTLLMSKRYSVNELVDQDKEVRTHWIWDEELPRGDQLDENGKCIVCDLPHPNSPQLWIMCRQSGQSKMIEERHEGHEFVVNQNHGSVNKST